ncbi:UDP-N-acetylmuramoyl-L-alanyl-D-glutamate--2,6-diaminopimelate ligase [Pseudoduganella ginsengisoli]
MNATEISNWIKQHGGKGQLVSDSRRVKAGDVFFAYPGDGKDGRSYIASAVAQGAAAVVLEAEGAQWDTAWNVPHLEVADLKRQSGPIAHAFYDTPDRAMYSVAVTGTNGKTSCAVWLGQTLSRLGQQTAVIGTLGVGMFRTRGEPDFDPTGYTTPDAVLLAQKLAESRDAGAQALAIEVTSIALDLGRTDGMHFDTALFTNLTRDHLDHHGSMEAYEAAKMKLFDWPGLKTAVVNLDDVAGLRIIERLSARAAAGEIAVMGYTLQEEAARPAIANVAMLRATQVRTRSAGTEFNLDCPQGQAHVRTHLVGQFNISNALAVLGALLAKGTPLREAVAAIEAIEPAPGRMQQMGGAEAPLVVIDYAHTPDALEKTLSTLRIVAQERSGQLWCVFGCGGDRDPGKRPQMGRISQAADHVLVTSDNPRSEDPHAIIAQIVAGMDANHPQSVFQTVEDRAAAILSAVKHAGKQDVILLAGKGHEPYQEIKGRKMPFSDADHAQLALSARLTMMRPN